MGKRIVEINGVKLEIDTRTARKVDQYRVGDKVKVLVKEYSDNYKTHHGVIVAFDDFTALPTITVCYVKDNYGSTSLEFVYINAKSKDVELAPCTDEILITKADVMTRMQAEIDKKQAEVQDLQRKMEFFVKRFGVWFETPHAVISDDDND